LPDQCATVMATRSLTTAAGLYAPGHLGELTQYVPFELVGDVLARSRRVQLRLRLLPSRVGVYFVLALALFPGLGYARVWDKLIAGLPTFASPSLGARLGRTTSTPRAVAVPGSLRGAGRSTGPTADPVPRENSSSGVDLQFPCGMRRLEA